MNRLALAFAFVAALAPAITVDRAPALVQAADAAARHHALVTVGIVPAHADPGLGYIEPGDVVSEPLRRVRRFVEKPSVERATTLIAAGGLWNSGIFAWRAGDCEGTR